MEPHSEARERVHTALFAVDDADRRSALETRLAQGSDGLRESSSGRDDVLDQADAVTGFERPLDPVRRPVLLGLVADDHERKPRRDRRGRGEDDGPEDRTGEAHGLGLVLLDGGAQAAAERFEDVRLRLEAELVEVEGRALAGAEDEVALEVAVLDERPTELRRRSRRCADFAGQREQQRALGAVLAERRQ